MKKYNQVYAVDEKLLASAVFFSEDSILITTPDLEKPGPKIVYVNPGFTRMTGYSPQEVLGKTPRLLQGPKTDRDVLSRLRADLKQGKVFRGQAINYRKDGSEFWNEWHIEPIRDGNGRLTHYLAIQRDVTQRVQFQQAIEQKNATLREILEHIEMEKKKIKDGVLLNVEKILLPALKKMRRHGSRLDKKYLDVLEENLREMTSSFGTSVSERKLKLSPREVEISNLIKNGIPSKEICQMLHLSPKTVETHRNRIRKKFGLVNKDVNLISFLQNI